MTAFFIWDEELVRRGKRGADGLYRLIRAVSLSNYFELLAYPQFLPFRFSGFIDLWTKLKLQSFPMKGVLLYHHTLSAHSMKAR